MNTDTVKGNSTLLKLTDRYQHISFGAVTLPVPYFINTAEQVYKQAMAEAGIEKDLITKTMQLIKEGKTSLGSVGGKGTPEQITEDLKRLMVDLAEQGYNPKDSETIRKWMVEMHIGLDCSGYIYNIVSEIEKEQNVEILKHLAWASPESMKPSHAGAFIFDSEKLKEITNYTDLMPLDILVRKDYTHVGILVEIDRALYLADCSMGRNGITFNKTLLTDKELVIDGYDSWTNHLRDREVVIRRLDF